MDMKMRTEPTAATEPTAVPVPTDPAGLRSGGQGEPHAMTRSAGTAAVVVPPAGDYHLDPVRSAVTFGTRHLFGLGAVHGSFHIESGQIHVADPPQASWARVTIPAASFHTGHSGRDSAVRSQRLLAADVHPDITFTSTGLELLDARWVLHGRLSVRGFAGPVDVASTRPIGTDRASLVTAGRVIANDSPSGLIASIGIQQRIRFHPSGPIADGLLTALPGVSSVTAAADDVIVTGTGDVLGAVTFALAQAGIVAERLDVQRASLEDAFVVLTGRSA